MAAATAAAAAVVVDDDVDDDDDDDDDIGYNFGTETRPVAAPAPIPPQVWPSVSWQRS